MSAKPFLDTNVVAYALANDARKKSIAEGLLLDRPSLSVQVINELVSVGVRKLGYSREASIAAARMVMRTCEVLPMDVQDVERAFQLTERYGFAHWDALILVVALRYGCDVVYSEDMQHGQEIAPGLTVINPFMG
jgi:predicted nucleic acid-binding protein